jgi:hypothetical protein
MSRRRSSSDGTSIRKTLKR